jgi:hypothetical protein
MITIAELTHEVFYRCDRVPLPYAPYNGRTPFRTFAEEDFSPAHVLGLVIYARRAILRGILRDHYERNLRRDPLVRLDAERFATIRRVLRGAVRAGRVHPDRRAEVTARSRPSSRWSCGRTRSSERLRRRAADSVEDRALAVVRWLQEASVEQVHALITAADPLPLAAAPDQPPEELPERHLAAAPVDGELISAVRVAVVRGWAKLGPEERRLMRAVTSGDAVHPSSSPRSPPGGAPRGSRAP